MKSDPVSFFGDHFIVETTVDLGPPKPPHIKHILESKYDPTTLNYMAVYGCKECSFMMIFHKIQLRQILMGNIPYTDDVIYRSWYA